MGKFELAAWVAEQHKGTTRANIRPDGITEIVVDGNVIKEVKTPKSQIRPERTSLLWKPNMSLKAIKRRLDVVDCQSKGRRAYE